MTIAVDSSFGATGSFVFSRDAGGTTTTITFGSGTETLFISGGHTAGAGGTGTGVGGFVFTTVSSSTITDLG